MGTKHGRFISFYLLYSQLYQSICGFFFAMYLPGQSSCHLYMACQPLQNMASGHLKVKKGTGHVFYMATPSHATDSIVAFYIFPIQKFSCLYDPNYTCIQIEKSEAKHYPNTITSPDNLSVFAR